MGTDTLLDKKRKIDVSEALKLRLQKNWTYQEIGDKYNCTKQAVHDALKPFTALIQSPEAIQAYQDNKAQILTSVEMELVKNLLDPAKLKDASLNNTAYSFNTVHAAGRLERNQSSSIIDLRLSPDQLQRMMEAAQATVIDVTPKVD